MGIANISIFSLISAIIFFNIGLLIIKILRQNTNFLIKNSTTLLITLFSLTIIRIIIPLDMIFAIVIPSKNIIPSITKLLSFSLIKGLSIGTLILVIWIIGIIITLCRSLSIISREIKMTKEYKNVEDENIQTIARHFIDSKVEVIVSPEVDVPKTTGIKKSYIFMPTLMLTDDEIKVVLMHEYQHIIGRDIYIKLFYVFIKAIFWWNPLVHIFMYEVENLLELRCDSIVTKDMKEDERIFYLETILKIVCQVNLSTTKHSTGNISYSTLIGYNTQQITKQRFEIILNKAEKYSYLKRIRNLTLIFIAFICSYCIIFQSVHYPTGEDIEGYINISAENAHIVVDTNNIMKLYVDEEFYGVITKEELDTPPYNELVIIRKEK